MKFKKFAQFINESNHNNFAEWYEKIYGNSDNGFDFVDDVLKTLDHKKDPSTKAIGTFLNFLKRNNLDIKEVKEYNDSLDNDMDLDDVRHMYQMYASKGNDDRDAFIVECIEKIIAFLNKV